MSGMTAARMAVVEDLQAVGFTVKDHVPAKVVPPLVIVSTGDPMLEESGTYSQTKFIYHLTLYVIIGTKPNAESVSGLDDMVEKVIFNLGDWTIEHVSPPEMRTANEYQFLTVSVSIKNTINIEGGE